MPTSNSSKVFSTATNGTSHSVGEVRSLVTPDRPLDSTSSRGRKLLEENLHLIYRRLGYLGRLSGLPEHEAEELRSWAMLKLVENDYHILGSWKGRSSFSTFVAVVLANLMRDYRIRVWGKWRPSAMARHHGPVAVLLERLYVRDSIPLDEAIEKMQAEHGICLSRAELEQMATLLLRRPERQWVSEEELLQIPFDGQVESLIEASERAHLEERLRELLAPVLQSLPAQDRLLLKLYYWDSLSMAAISLLLGRPQRELYSVRDRCLRKLRRNLEDAGFSSEQVGRLSGCSHLDLTLEFAHSR